MENFLVENECKTSIGRLHLFSIKNIFFDKMGLQLFYFRVTIYLRLPCEDFI